MIEFKLEPLTLEQQRKLQEWLARSECSILRTVVDALCKEKQVKALTEGLKAADDPTQAKLSEVTMREAARYQTFLNVLDELSAQDAPLNSIKLK